MTKILFVGDLHGDGDRAERIIEIAKNNSCAEIIQVGDWGFIWPRSNTHKELSLLLQKADMSMRFCDGNHDVHPVLRSFKEDTEENVEPKLTYQFRGSKAVIGGLSIVFLGGAPSIDKDWRKPGVSWWEEEEITKADIEKCMRHKYTHVDVLVTHDAPERVPGIKETSNAGFNYRSDSSTNSIASVIRALRPEYNIHGHYHHRYSKLFEGTQIEGLGSNMERVEENYFILDKDPGDLEITKPERPSNGRKKRETKES
jgi:Icc-related predicted phosphoesterase